MHTGLCRQNGLLQVEQHGNVHNVRIIKIDWVVIITKKKEPHEVVIWVVRQIG